MLHDKVIYGLGIQCKIYNVIYHMIVNNSQPCREYSK